MVINCESCHAALEVPDSLADGQPVRCPYCHCRFIYASRVSEKTGEGEDAKQSSARQTPVDGSAELWAAVLPFCRHVLSSWVSAWKSMFDFGGRMARREYLEFAVFHFLAMTLFRYSVGGNFGAIGNSVSGLMFFFFWIMLFTLISATVRRLHDMNRSGLWLLILIPIGLSLGTVKFWFLCLALLVVIGLLRTRDKGNAYSPLKSILGPLVALVLIPSLTSRVIERVLLPVKKCDVKMTKETKTTDVTDARRQQYANTKEWYNYQLDYNGLREILFTDDRISAATLVFQGDGGQSVHISYMYGCDVIQYSRSLQKGFARDLIKARMFIENYEKNEKR